MKSIVVTAGEPAGIGPDIVLMAAMRDWPAQLVCVADKELLATRAVQLGLDVTLTEYQSGAPTQQHQPGVLPIVHIPLNAPCTAGKLDIKNASYVLATLEWAIEACRSNEAAAMVTGPVQKSIIADSGIAFSGHTEFLAEATGADRVVMLLASGELRVALATTHLPLSAVPAAITRTGLYETLDTLISDLRSRFGIESPSVAVLGLNPHAGEGGHLGTEELDVITPVCAQFREQGVDVIGPLPADTAFNADIRSGVDAYLAMYHDQGLPVLKFAGFGDAVNITLGLPIIRTSVDHGTAMTLAGTGKSSAGSLIAALDQAISLANRGSIT